MPPNEVPPPGSGTVPSGTLRFVRNGMLRLGAAPEALSLEVGALSAAGAGEDARESTDLLARLWRLGLAELDDPLLGLHVSEQWSRGSLQLHDYLFGTAATLGEGLALAVRYAHIVSDSAGANDVDLVEEAGGRAMAPRLPGAHVLPRSRRGGQSVRARGAAPPGPVRPRRGPLPVTGRLRRRPAPPQPGAGRGVRDRPDRLPANRPR